jgi:hypothetical protein
MCPRETREALSAAAQPRNCEREDAALRITSSVDLFAQKQALTILPYVDDGSSWGFHRFSRYNA